MIPSRLLRVPARNRAECVVFGAASLYTWEASSILERAGVQVRALIDNVGDWAPPEPLPGLVSVDEIEQAWLDLDTIVPLTTPGHRYRAVDHAKRLGFHRFPPLVDPTAVVAASAEIGEGTVINSGAVVGARTLLGRFTSVNRSASVGHHNRMGDFVSLGPGCLLAGKLEIGRGAFIGAGAVVSDGVSIGANSIVGAGTVVVKDVPDHVAVVGNPARVLHEDVAGYNDATVP